MFFGSLFDDNGTVILDTPTRTALIEGKYNDILTTQFFGVGTDFKLYRKPENNNNWVLVGGNNINITAIRQLHNGTLVAIGQDGYLYTKSIFNITSNWTKLSENSCCVIGFDVVYNLNQGILADNSVKQTLIGVGTRQNVYTTTNLTSGWIDNGKCCITDIKSINGTLIGIGTDNKIYIRPPESIPLFTDAWTKLEPSLMSNLLNTNVVNLFGGTNNSSVAITDVKGIDVIDYSLVNDSTTNTQNITIKLIGVSTNNKLCESSFTYTSERVPLFSNKYVVKVINFTGWKPYPNNTNDNIIRVCINNIDFKYIKTQTKSNDGMTTVTKLNINMINKVTKKVLLTEASEQSVTNTTPQPQHQPQQQQPQTQQTQPQPQPQPQTQPQPQPQTQPQPQPQQTQPQQPQPQQTQPQKESGISTGLIIGLIILGICLLIISSGLAYFFFIRNKGGNTRYIERGYDSYDNNYDE
jgi:hypothetical protein